MSELQGWLAGRREEIEGWLPGAIRAEAPSLAEAMSYSLLGGGKRLRPILVLGAAEACGLDERTPLVVDLCCAVEMVHTYSLIHDDLPAMDDDALRRGRPTNHKVYGEALAILAGDALLTDAFGRVAAGVEPVRGELVRRLCDAAGSAGMVAGQTLDIGRVAVGGSVDAVENIHRLKTGALISFAAEAGALAAGASEEQARALQEFGSAVGLAFQIADDLLDVAGDPARMGKEARKDVARDTATMPGVAGVDAARARARALADTAKEALGPLGDAAGPLRLLADHVVERDA